MNAPVLPILLPLLTALLGLFRWRPSPARRVMFITSFVLQLAVACGLLARALQGPPLVLGVGRWSAQVGIVLALDPLGALMVVLSALTGLIILLFNYAEASIHVEHPLRVPLIQFLLMGINLSFCTGDLFNLFVGFEIMLIASYALLTLEADDWSIKQAYPYLALNLVGSTLFICAAGLLYALAGTLNYAILHERLAGLVGDPRLTAVGVLLLFVFMLKAGLFPFFYWLPNSYPILPTPLTALYAGLLTKVGVFVLIRIFGTVFPHELTSLHQIVAVLAVVTILAGSLGALARGYVRGMLVFHVVAAVGFMLLPLGWLTPFAVAACIFYMLQDVVVKTGLFLTAGAVTRWSGRDDLIHLGGLWKRAPGLGLVFLCLGLSLSGVPPFSGFWGKLAIVQAGIARGEYAAIAVVLVGGLLTLIAILRVWHFAFWRAAPESTPLQAPRHANLLTAVAGVTAVLSLVLGLAAEPAFQLAQTAADRALNADSYVAAVRAYIGKGGD